MLFDPGLVPAAGDRVRIIAVSALLREMMLHSARWPVSRAESGAEADSFFSALGTWSEGGAVAGNGSTQDSILREAGRLFALKGFHGTSTREIAEAVGIRQPSLFHHFASKHHIADALFAYDHSHSYVLRGQPELPDATPPVRLYQTVRREVLVELTSAYDLRGLYLTAVIEEPGFARWQLAVTQALEFMRYQIDEGTRTGDFIEGDHSVVVEILDAVLNQVVRRAGRVHGTARPDDLAAAVLRLVLKRPSRIPGIRREADRLLARSGVNWPDELAVLG